MTSPVLCHPQSVTLAGHSHPIPGLSGQSSLVIGQRATAVRNRSRKMTWTRENSHCRRQQRHAWSSTATAAGKPTGQVNRSSTHIEPEGCSMLSMCRKHRLPCTRLTHSQTRPKHAPFLFETTTKRGRQYVCADVTSNSALWCSRS